LLVRRGSLLVALFLAALTLRPQLVGVGPLLPSIQADLGVSHAFAGLLATIPVLCMGLFAPPAPYVSARAGSRRAIAGAVAVVGAFGIARALVPGAAGVVLLTIPIGIGMGLAGAMLPVAVKERFADRPGFATGVYAVGLTLGSAIAAAAAVPLADLGSGWRTPLLVFGVVSTGLAAVWLVLTRAGPAQVRLESRPLRLPFSNPLAWRLVAAFFFMSAIFYGLNSWLPDIYVERGWSESDAGALLAVLNTISIPCGFAAAWAADHWGERRMWLAAAATLQLAAPGGSGRAGRDDARRRLHAVGALTPPDRGAPRSHRQLHGCPVGARGRCGGAGRRRRKRQPATARNRSIVSETPAASGVQLIPPSASSRGAPSNSSGNGSLFDSSTFTEVPLSASIAAAASAIVTAGPPRWKTRAPASALRAAATNTLAVSGAN
jgi:CP family cyanate transporter-like MFS transporter